MSVSFRVAGRAEISLTWSPQCAKTTATMRPSASAPTVTNLRSPRVGILAGQAGGVGEHCLGVLKGDVVLRENGSGLRRVPTDVHEANMYFYMH